MKRQLSNAISLAVLMGGAPAVVAQVVIPVTRSSGFQDNGKVPDFNLSGWSDSADISRPGYNRITGMTVTLEISSDSNSWNSDLYGYLSSPNGASSVVLLNRVGQTTLNPNGYMNSGFSVTFASAGNDIHQYQDFSPTYSPSGQVTGTWQADGRPLDTANPYAIPTTTRTSSIDSFLNQDPNGRWTLFVADLSSGGQSTVTSWGMQITAVPEPGEFAALTALALGGFSVVRRFRAKKDAGFAG